MRLSGIIELRPGWFVQLPHPMTEWEFSRYRFDPITITFIALAATAATLSVVAAQEQADTNKKLADYNAKVAAQEAEAKRRAGAAQVDLLQERKERMLASSRASTAKSGITSAGAPLLVDIETAELSAFDQVTARYNTQVDVNRSLSEVNLYKYQGKQAKRAGRLAVGAAIFSGAAGVAGAAYQGSLQKPPGTTGNLPGAAAAGQQWANKPLYP